MHADSLPRAAEKSKSMTMMFTRSRCLLSSR